MTRSLAALPLIPLLAACGGGGVSGGSSAFLVPEVPFTTFSAVKPQTTVVMSDAVSSTVSGTYTGTAPTSSAIGNLQMSPGGAPLDNTSSGNTQKLTYDRNKIFSGMSFITPSAEASFSRANGTTFDCPSGVCTASNATGSGQVIDGTTTPLGWNYQTFGIWDRLVTGTAFQAGAISAGTVTPSSAVPTTGTATFSGLANSFYTDSSGTPFFTTSSMTANVNWGAKSIDFSTANTSLTNLNTGAAGTPALGLNLTGTLIYNPALNRFTGPVAPAVTAMNGTATGRFYGPAAQEIGGTFSLQGAGGTMVGGFGGKR